MVEQLSRVGGLAILLLCVACIGSDRGATRATGLTDSEFNGLLTRLARAWQDQHAQAAVDLFTADAIYMQPPDVQLFVGREQLRAYFGAVEPGTTMVWHQIWFDPEAQVGTGEFTFGIAGRAEATHGVAIIELRDGRIARWHEYLQPGPAAREHFLSLEGKSWQWHIGNYP